MDVEKQSFSLRIDPSVTKAKEIRSQIDQICFYVFQRVPAWPRGRVPRPTSIDGRRVPVRNQLSGLSLLGPMNSTPSIGMSFSLMAFCTQCWYFRKLSVHGSPLRSPFRNFSANQRLKHWSYSRFSSVHASPTLFMSETHAEILTRRLKVEEFLCSSSPQRHARFASLFEPG